MNLRQGHRVSWTLAVLGILLSILSCTTSGGPRETNREPASKNTFTMTGSSLVYEYERGRVDFETRDLLDIYDNGVIDLIRSPDPQVRHLLERVPFKGEFYVVVMNGHSSPASLIQINEKYYFTKDYSQKSREFAKGLDVPFNKYSFGSRSGAKTLKNLKIHLVEGSDQEPKFVSTNRLCVVRNLPGPKGEYRNGALTVQLIETNARTAAKGARLLAEFSVFRESELEKCR